MKKKTIIILSIIFGLLVISGLVIALVEQDPRKIVWNKLSIQQKAEIIGTWRDAKLEKVIADRISILRMKDAEYYNGKELYRITFRTKRDPLIGPITVFFDPRTKVIVGWGGRA